MTSRNAPYIATFGDRPGIRWSDILVPTLNLCSLGLWFVLYRWYSVWEHIATPGFSFDKVPGHFHSPTLRFTAVIFALLVALYAASYVLMSRGRLLSPRARSITALTILGAGLLNVITYPVVGIDVFVYLMELKLTFFHHQNPYIVTVAPAYLGDPWANYHAFRHSPLIYGPAWLLGTAGPVVLAGFDSQLRALLVYKTFSFLVVLVAGLIIYIYHGDRRRGWLAAYAFAANPLILFEAAAQGHNDIMLTALLLAAVLAFQRRSSFAGPLLVLSALVKFFTVLLAPLFIVYAFREGWSKGRIGAAVILSTVTGVATIAPFWANGEFVTGMRRAAAISQSLYTASFSSLVRAALQEQPAEWLILARLALAGIFALAILVIMWRFKSLDRALACVLVLCYTLVSSFQPWYLLPVIGLLALRLDRLNFAWICAASVLSLEIFMLDVWARFHSGLSFLQRHVLGSVFLSLTMLIFVALAFWYEARSARRTRKTGAPSQGP